MITYWVHRRTAAGWQPESGGRFEVGQTAETSSDVMARTAAVAYASTLTEVGAEVKVIRTETRQVWPASHEYRTSEIPVDLEQKAREYAAPGFEDGAAGLIREAYSRGAQPRPERDLEWHEGKHHWELHDGYPRHQHSINGALTIAPGDTQLHFAWSKFEKAGPQ